MSDSIVTDIGIAKINAFNDTGDPVVITHIAIGDGAGSGYDPDGTETALRNEVWRGEVSETGEGENSRWYAVNVPADTGAFWMREIGIFDADGDLIAIGKLPATYKLRAETGAGTAMEVRLIVSMALSNQAAVNVAINTPSINGVADVEQDRTSGEIYTNTSGKTMFVMITGYAIAENQHFKVRPNSSAAWVRLGYFFYGGPEQIMNAVVPAGWQYMLDSDVSLALWAETY